MGSSLDEFYLKLQAVRDRICCEETPEVIEIHRDDLSNIGRQVLTCLLDDRRDIFPAGCGMIFSQGSCLALGRRVVGQLFKMKVSFNESSNLNLKGQIKVYSPSGEWMCELK